MDFNREDSPEVAQLTKSGNFKPALIRNLELHITEIEARTRELHRRSSQAAKAPLNARR